MVRRTRGHPLIAPQKLRPDPYRDYTMRQSKFIQLVGLLFSSNKAFLQTWQNPASSQKLTVRSLNAVQANQYTLIKIVISSRED